MSKNLVKYCSIYIASAEKEKIKCAGILFVDPVESSVFLMRRADGGDDRGKWSLPGGHLNHGESFLEAAKRETKEEAGSMPNISKSPLFVYNNDLGHLIYRTYVIALKPSEKENWVPKLNKEHDKSGWFKLNNLPENTHEGVLLVLKEMKKLT